MNPIIQLIFFIIDIINAVIPVLVAAGVLFFLFNVARYGFSSSDSDRQEIRGIIVNGVIVLFVMVSVWGLVNILGQTFVMSGNAVESRIMFGKVPINGLFIK